MDKTKELFAVYVNAAADLAENVKRNIKYDDAILDDGTVLALNNFIKAAQAIKYLTDELNKDKVSIN